MTKPAITDPATINPHVADLAQAVPAAAPALAFVLLA